MRDEEQPLLMQTTTGARFELARLLACFGWRISVYIGSSIIYNDYYYKVYIVVVYLSCAGGHIASSAAYTLGAHVMKRDPGGPHRVVVTRAALVIVMVDCMLCVGWRTETRCCLPCAV